MTSKRAIDPFEQQVRAIAQRLRQSVPDLTAREVSWLDELAREECRYPMITVRRICAAARRSRRVEDREAFADLILAECTPADAMPIEEALDLETRADSADDVPQRDFELHPSPITFARCRDALVRQSAATHQALRSLFAWQRKEGAA